MANQHNDNRIDLREILHRKQEAEGAHGKLRFIPAKDLKVDHRYQRHPNMTHVRRIAKNFNPQIFGTIDVSERDNGDCYIVNGQHRVTAILEMGKADTPIPCIVHSGLGYESEALMFHMMNTQTKPMTAQEKLKGAIEASDPVALSIRDSVYRAGFKLNLEDSDRSNGLICGVGGLSNVHKQYRDGHLDMVLQLIAATWGTETGPRHTMIEGVAIFISFYRDEWDRKRFISQLRRVDQETIIASSRQIRTVLGVSTGLACTYRLLDHYNRNIVTRNRLPSIEEQRAINKMKGKGND